MTREHGLEKVERDERSVVTVGTFDGLHAGHQTIVRRLLERARQQDGVSTVVTFDPHPREVLRGEEVPLLTTVDERGDFLEAMGVDRFIVVRFDDAFAHLEPRAYVEKILLGRVGLQEVVVGYDHRFGHGGAGDSSLMEQLGQEHGFRVEIIPAAIIDEAAVSSTQIRELVAEGDMQRARELLTRPYRLDGTVVRGEGRGQQIGFPTANLQVNAHRKIIPPTGVYAVRVERPDDTERLGGMMNIGYRPTFGGGDKQIEVHLFDFDDSLYEQTLRVDFVRRIRDEKAFDGVDELVEQLRRDKDQCHEILAAS